MADVSPNPSFHRSKPPHKFSNKLVLLRNKPTKKSTTRSRNKNNKNNLMVLNNSNNNNNNNNNSSNNSRPLKVVHISNPMKFQVAAAEFRALVQGLTGRDSVVEWPIDHDAGQVVAAATTADDDSADGVNNSTDDHSSHDEVNDQQNDEHHHYQEDEVVNNHFLSSVSACFEPSDHHHLMSFDYSGTHFNFNGDVTVEDDVHQLYGCYYGGLSSPSFYGQSLLH